MTSATSVSIRVKPAAPGRSGWAGGIAADRAAQGGREFVAPGIRGGCEADLAALAAAGEMVEDRRGDPHPPPGGQRQPQHPPILDALFGFRNAFDRDDRV